MKDGRIKLTLILWCIGCQVGNGRQVETDAKTDAKLRFLYLASNITLDDKLGRTPGWDGRQVGIEWSCMLARYCIISCNVRVKSAEAYFLH
uniref:Uncharacterized protein n=1 Tax=Romanomermis culicivorax TaxID=13658 RepID=A0A915IW80_ROMCU